MHSTHTGMGEYTPLVFPVRQQCMHSVHTGVGEHAETADGCTDTTHMYRSTAAYNTPADTQTAHTKTAGTDGMHRITRQ